MKKFMHKFLFLLQIQFVAIFTHQFQLLWTDCDYPKGFMVWIGLHGIMFLFLFSDFYKQSYIDKKEKLKTLKKESANGKVYANGTSNHHSDSMVSQSELHNLFFSALVSSYD